MYHLEAAWRYIYIHTQTAQVVQLAEYQAQVGLDRKTICVSGFGSDSCATLLEKPQ